MTDQLESQVFEQLDQVYDRCSCYTDDPVSVVEMGMIQDVSIDRAANRVEIEMLVTSPMCTFFLDMAEEIKERVSSLPDVDTVAVSQDTSGTVWTPDRMADEARTRRRERLERRLDDEGITPYAKQQS
jgi:ATP-binding protein involved in chromosome partitioning